MPSTSLTLIQRIRDGDELAWKDLVDLYGPLVYFWCRNNQIEENDSADILQAVLASVTSAIERFRLGEEGTSFRGWLFGIARNKIRDHFRDRQKRPDRGLGGGLDETIAVIDDPAWMEDEPDLIERDHRFLIQRAVEQIRQELSETDWRVFYQTVVSDQNATAVAEELGISPAAVRQRKSRVMRRLRTHFEGLEDFLDSI
ncbi:MAG: sigma-70 family RNA polymerase sigma factor [Planctomycetota bacterium]